jgi:diphosphomevalonate decarboxylase
VGWQASDKDGDSFGASIAPPEHWALVDCIAIVSEGEKATGSTQGHKLAATSPFQAARLAGAAQRFDLCKKIILDRDFLALADLVELDCHLMHAVMMTSLPPLHYWMPASLAIMEAVRGWRRDGLPVCYTLDAGPNVHVLCPAGEADRLSALLVEVPGVIRVLRAGPGGPAHIID